MKKIIEEPIITPWRAFLHKVFNINYKTKRTYRGLDVIEEGEYYFVCQTSSKPYRFEVHFKAHEYLTSPRGKKMLERQYGYHTGMKEH